MPTINMEESSSCQRSRFNFISARRDKINTFVRLNDDLTAFIVRFKGLSKSKTEEEKTGKNRKLRTKKLISR